MTEYALELNDLAVSYNNFKLYIPNYCVKKGYVTGLIGRNGSGKTTMINGFLELIRRNRGDIKILGMNFEDNGLEIKDRIAYVNDQFYYPLSMTGERLASELGPFYSNFDILYFKNLSKKLDVSLDTKFKSLSLGMKMKISIAFSLAHHPDFIILDEPTSNLDPISRHQVLDLIYDIMQDESKTVLFSTHITSDLDKIADEVTLIDDGEIVFSMNKDHIQEENQIVFGEGTIPDDLKKVCRSIEETKDGFKALCTQSSKFINNPKYQFKKASIEDIMIYWGL